MTCEKARELMYAAIDGELDQGHLRSLEEHLDSCGSCTIEFEELKYMIQMAGELPLKELPDDFNKTLHSKLMSEAKTETWLKKLATKRNAFVLGSVAVLLVAVFAGRNLLGGMGSTDMAKSESAYDFVGEMETTAAAEAPASVQFNTSMKSDDALDGGAGTRVEATESSQITNETYREGRLIIHSASINMDIEDYDGTFMTIRNWVEGAGGYVESESTSLKTNYGDGKDLKYGYLTLRIPVHAYGTILTDLKSLGHVTRDYANAYDVTKQYRDTASEVENLKVTENRLREIMTQATEIEDILSIENELTRIRGSINAYERQLKDWEALADLTTVTVELNEVNSLETVIEPIDDSLWGKAKEGFIDTINGIKKAVERFVIWTVSKSPILLGIAGIVFVVQKIYFKRRKRNET